MRSLQRFRALVCLFAAVGILLAVPATQGASQRTSTGLELVRDVPAAVEEGTAGSDMGFPVHHLFPRSNYAWPYAMGPSYGKADVGVREAGVLVTSVGTFRLGAGELPIPAELRSVAKAARRAFQFYVVQLDPATITADSRQAVIDVITSTGGNTQRNLPVAAFIAKLSPAGLDAVLSAPGVIAVEPYHPAFKLNPTIGRTPLVDPEAAVSDTYNLDVLLFEGEDGNVVAEAIRSMGGQVTMVSGNQVRGSLNRSKLADLAGIESVFEVHEYIAPQVQGQETTNAVQTGGIDFNANPYHAAGVDGTGQVLMILDNGVSLDAADLADTDVSAGAPGPAHRKVLTYDNASLYGGVGDQAGCDSPTQGGFTHGHMVAAVALGNPEFPAQTFRATDANGNLWDLKGVAPGAKLAFVDAQITPAVGSCGDPVLGALNPGDLYSGGGTGSLETAYATHGARTFNLSWGNVNNTYGTVAQDIDSFLLVRRDAAVFVPVGNTGRDANADGTPDPGSVIDTATAKNAIVVGGHGAPDDFNIPANINERFQAVQSGSGVGPAGAQQRIAPLVMAPAQERALATGGGTGVDSESACTTGDNDQGSPVLCDTVSNKAGTSFASAAAAGAGMLVRDYFAQGFYPDGTASNTGNATDQVSNVSGALVKALLVGSASMIGVGFGGTTVLAPVSGLDNVTIRYRFNREQGYGRIQLDNILPLEGWARSASGLVVGDVGISGGVNDFAGIGPIDAVGGATQTTTFDVCDDTQELRVALAWVDDVGDGLLNDLDLEVIAPSGRTYYGNYFTDDVNRNGTVDATTENCPTAFNDGTANDGGFDRSRWSLPVCVRADATLPAFDGFTHPILKNPTEAVYLSPNPQGDFDENGQPQLRGGQCSVSGDGCGYDAQCPGAETCTGGTAQVEAGTWTVKVHAKAAGTNAAQRFALIAGGGVCMGSSARFDQVGYVCNDEAKITINERAEAADPAGGLSVAEVASRTTVQVVDSNDVVRDSESGTALAFSQPDANVLQFVAEDIPITDGTAYDPGNGVLDVQSGDRVVVVYADETSGAADPDKVRTASSTVGCTVNILTGSVTFAQWRRDETFFVSGGCEVNARGLRESGAPDKYMDAGERLAYRFGFGSIEDVDLQNVELELRCVLADADSPESCRPGTTDCADPNRTNNSPCTQMSILDPIKVIGQLDANSAVAANFSIVMANTIAGTPEVDMLLALRAQSAGKTVSTLAVNRHKLNVDAVHKFYSTDFPKGGTEIQDRDNNGIIESPTTTGLAGSPLSNDTDYKFEMRVFSDLTIGKDASGNQVLVNTGINAPWNFDNNDGAFTSGINAESDDALIASTIAQWGEDKNFNNKLDGKCQASPSRPCDRFAEDPFNCGILCPECNFDFVCVGLEDRDPANVPIPLLDQNWSTNGGCGWQTKAPGTCSLDGTIGCYSNSDCGDAAPCNLAAPQATGGVWHTGTIRNLAPIDCAFAGTSPGRCQLYETLAGTTGLLLWNEILATPVLTKVNQQLDAAGKPLAEIEIVDFKWNQSIGLGDNNVLWWWEVDTDRDKLEPVDLYSDLVVLNSLRGAATGFGAADPGSNSFLTRGYGVFAPINPGTNLSQNGTLGNNRVGQNSCYFEGGAVADAQLVTLGLAGPPDDDAPEGYCGGDGGLTATTSNNGITGETWYSAQDGHINYCTTVCSDQTDVLCANNAKCVGTCMNPGLNGFCTNAPHIPGCTSNADCNFGTCVDIVCNGTCSDNDTCTNDGSSCTTDADCTEPCIFTQGQASIDQYVFPNGPTRNVELGDVNGTEMRVNTLEDIYGDTGVHFQAAIGFQNEQARTNPEAQTAFGLAIDDPVLEWTEFTLEEDTTNCAASGACATVNIQQNNVYQGNTVLRVIVTDSSPSNNDCNWDGVQENTRDCNNNGIDDVPVQVLWLENPNSQAFEIVIADSIGQDAYEGNITVSSSYDVAGTLYIATSGLANPTVRARYFDYDDGTGSPCENSVDPASWGLVNHNITVFLTPANLVVTRASFQDNVDNDGWADNSETVQMRVEVANKTPNTVTGVSLRLSSNDPKVECITRPFLDFGDLAAGEARFSSEAFEFIMSSARRSDAFQDFSATVTVSMDANEFQSNLTAQNFSFDVDLDATGGSGPSQYFEGFEGGFGSFTTMHLDETLNPPPGDILNHSLGVLAADDWRCQYSDPDWQGSASFNNSQGLVCYPTSEGIPDTYYWHVATERSFTGVQSLHYGVFLDGSLLYTTPRAQLEAIRTTEPVNLGWANVCSVTRTQFCANDAGCPSGETCASATPLFTFKHQVSMIDGRVINSQGPRLRSADRTIVGVQLADESTGDPVGSWIRMEPFVNLYDTQANSNYFNCTFDPADDGNTEEDFFDPSDPLRSLGPSSMCSPNFNFAFQGSTILLDRTRLGKASDGPGLLASDGGGIGPGTWVEPRFDLSRFRGRRLRLRFVATGLHVASAPLWHPQFVNNTALNPDPRDDGWFIDSVSITDTLTDPASVLVEQTTNPDAQCGDSCTTADAIIDVAPTTSPAPGQVVSIDMSGSTLDRCTGGVPQYQFWIDTNRDGDIDVLSDLLLRDWSQNAELLDTPFGDTRYLAAIRCATDTSCTDFIGANVAVNCPGDDSLGAGSQALPFLGREPLNRRPIQFLNKTTIVWASTATVDFVRGSLNTLRATGTFTGTVAACLLDDSVDTSQLVDATVPAVGQGFYYLGRSASSCNLQAGGSYDSATRDAQVNADGNSCPE